MYIRDNVVFRTSKYMFSEYTPILIQQRTHNANLMQLHIGV